MSKDTQGPGVFVRDVPGSQCNDENITVDIIAVSAVGADPVDTWRGGSSKLGWLEEELLQQLPLARVLYYDHDVSQDDDLDVLANRLLAAMNQRYSEYPADEPVNRPLIFLCHSTGGLVVKQALTFAWEEKWKYPLISKNVIGFAFFAVPHWGSPILSDPEFVSSARQRMDNNWEYDTPRIKKPRKAHKLYRHPLPPKFSTTLANEGESSVLTNLEEVFCKLICDPDVEDRFRVWDIHETIPAVFEPPWYEEDPDARHLLISQSQKPRAMLLAIETNISIPCDHYGVASFDTMHLVEERGSGALAQDLRPSFKMSFINQLQACVSQHYWNSEDITLSLMVENMRFYRDDGEILYATKSVSIADLIDEESDYQNYAKFKTLLHVDIPRNVESPVRKHIPCSTRDTNMPISILKNSKAGQRNSLTASHDGSRPESVCGSQAGNSIRHTVKTGDKSVRILAGSREIILPDHDFDDTRASIDRAILGSTDSVNSLEEHNGNPILDSKFAHPSGSTTLVALTESEAEDRFSVSDNSDQSVDSTCDWIHVPCNHISWAEKILSGVGFATENEDHCEEMLEERFWEKRFNFTTHDFPHARYIHSSCEFLGIETSESALGAELKGLLGAEGMSIIEKLFSHFSENGSAAKKKADTAHLTSSTARQMLFMPYLHWEPFHHFQRREEMIHTRIKIEHDNKHPVHIKSRLDSRTFLVEESASQTRIEGQLLRDVPLFTRLKTYMEGSPELKLIWQYIGSDPFLHCRRTLDQYMYSTLPDTTARDRDQILYKCEDIDDEHPSLNSVGWKSEEDEREEPRNILVVEQLWMFVLDDRKVITCFQPKEIQDADYGDNPYSMFSTATNTAPSPNMAARLRAQGDIRTCIMKDLDLEAEHIENHWDLAALVIKHVSTVFCIDGGPRIFSNFGKYIERLTERQARSWSRLRLRRDGNSSLGGSSREIQQIFQDLRDLRELRDVEDELRIIKKVLDKQKLHIGTTKKKYKESLGLAETSGMRYLEEALSVLEENLDRIRRMLGNVEMVSKGYEELLSLQQNQIAINEAVAAGEQSRAVTIFTVFTVLFLPPTFFTGVFGMNIQEWSGTPTNVSMTLVLTLMIPISFVVIAVTFIFAMNTRIRQFFTDTHDPHAFFPLIEHFYLFLIRIIFSKSKATTRNLRLFGKGGSADKKNAVRASTSMKADLKSKHNELDGKSRLRGLNGLRSRSSNSGRKEAAEEKRGDVTAVAESIRRRRRWRSLFTRTPTGDELTGKGSKLMNV